MPMERGIGRHVEGSDSEIGDVAGYLSFQRLIWAWLVSPFKGSWKLTKPIYVSERREIASVAM